MDKNKYVVYYRVSTNKQGISGLGIEAQKSQAAQFCKDGEIVAEFQEVEKGRRKDRPELLKAIELCNKNNYILIIARLDRLARNVYFTSALMESKVRFICIDMPNADNFTIHIFAAMAEREAVAISQRTKAALSALKARGVKLGQRKTVEAGSQRAKEIARMGALSRTYAAPDPYILEILRMYDDKGMSLDSMMICLSDLDVKMSRSTVHRVLTKYIRKPRKKKTITTI